MKVKFIEFGKIKIDGKKYKEDVVISKGKITLRDKAPSKQYKKNPDDHTPLSAKENIPWNCETLIIGTGAEGLLPVKKKVYKLAEERHVELIVVPTPKACKMMSQADIDTTNAILHVTC